MLRRLLRTALTLTSELPPRSPLRPEVAEAVFLKPGFEFLGVESLELSSTVGLLAYDHGLGSF